MKTARLVAAVLALAVGGFQDAEDAGRARLAETIERSKQRDGELAANYAGDANVMVRPGLVADRKARTVTVRAAATGLAGNATLEFFLISPASGKRYEALAVSMAKPSDIHAALEFIGVPAGRPIDYARYRYWPKGERVAMTFRWDAGGKPTSVRAEELMIDKRATAPVARAGFVFVGSTRVPGVNGGPERYYADLDDPGSIASNYNEATTVLDVPSRLRQGAVYEQRAVNPAMRLSAGQAIDVVLEPVALPGGVSHVVDVAVDVVGGPELPAATYAMGDLKAARLEAVLGKLAELCGGGREPFVTLKLNDGLRLGAVRDLYRILSAMQSDNGIRIEPVAGQLYYEAFLPDEKLRDYNARVYQAWEVHLEKRAAGVVGVFHEITERSNEANKFDVRQMPVTGPEPLRKMLRDRADERRPLAIYAPADMTYGELMAWVGPSLGENPVVWVFLPLK